MFHSIQGYDLNLDHHRQAPFGNLWTNISLGVGARPFGSGGNAPRGAYSGRGTTFWHMYKTPTGTVALPTCTTSRTTDTGTWGPFQNFVLKSYSGTLCSGLSWYARTHNSTDPLNLYAAQRAVRLAGK